MLRDRILKFLINKSPKDEYQETVSRVKSKREPPTLAQKNIQQKRKCSVERGCSLAIVGDSNNIEPHTGIKCSITLEYAPDDEMIGKAIIVEKKRRWYCPLIILVVQIFLLHD